MMTVHEVSQISGVSIRSLHHYDRIGLLPATEVAPNGYLVTADTTFIIDAVTGKITYGETEMPNDDDVLLVEDTMKRIPATVRKIWDDDDNRDGTGNSEDRGEKNGFYRI